MTKFLVGLILSMSLNANAALGTDHSGGDEPSDGCDQAVVKMNQSREPIGANLTIFHQAEHNFGTKFERSCLLADKIRSIEDKRFFHLSSDSNINAEGLGLEDAPLIYRLVCTMKTDFDDFYVVEDLDGSFRALYSQFLVSCPLKIIR